MTLSVPSETPRETNRKDGPLEQFRWCGRGETVYVQGREVRDPLTYVGSYGRDGKHAIDPSQIDRSLRIANGADPAPLPYWPWYRDMSAGQRHVYLTWLASDRKTLPPFDGYLFIYYYGLERRVLVDNADYELVFAEVQRLRALHAAQSQTRSRSFQNYSSEFLWYLVAVHCAKLKPEHVGALVRTTRNWTEDSLASALAWFADRQRPLEPWMAYVIAQESSLSQRSVVVRRVSEEFRKLFTQRVEAEFGAGMILRSSKRARQVAYRPASAALQRVRAMISNPLGVASQFRRLSEIWNQCIAELRKLASIARSGMPETLTADAWEAMPEELRSGIEHPDSSAICDLVINNTNESGHTFLRAGDLANTLGIQDRNKLSAKHSRTIASATQHAGFAIEPDVRLTGRSYQWGELLALFPHAYEGEPDYKRYGGAACILRLGLEIAAADGKVDDDELGRVMHQVETGFQLNDHERRRLEALRALLVQAGSDATGLGKRLQTVTDAAGRRSIGRLLVAVAAIDGVISNGELKALRRCFRALDLPPDLLEATLAELAPSADEAPLRVAGERPAPAGERIPAPRGAAEHVSLDRARILSIMEETREVSILLAEAMRVEAELAERQQPVASIDVHFAPPSCASTSAPTADPDRTMPSPTTNTFVQSTDGPPARYAAFCVELIAIERWTRAEADALARRHSHMLAGALEAINDWAFERFGGPLIFEEGDSIIVENSLLEGFPR